MRLIRLHETRHFGVPDDLEVTLRPAGARMEFARGGVEFAEVTLTGDGRWTTDARAHEIQHAQTEYSRLVHWLATAFTWAAASEQIFTFRDLPPAGPDSNVAVAEEEGETGRRGDGEKQTEEQVFE